jgi:hypothetical protein
LAIFFTHSCHVFHPWPPLAAALRYEVDGYESYWACNDGNGFQRQGLNGCATFVRKGLNVEAASCAPLESAELDDEGGGMNEEMEVF